MQRNYPQILSWIGLIEGGYVNHPDDPGGPTDRGITQATFDAWNRSNGLSPRPVRGITRELAEQILAVQYLDSVRAADLPAGLDYAVADYAVNSGPAQAVRDLQRELGVSADGVIGVHTLAAVAQAEIPDLILRLCHRRMRFLRGLKNWRSFGTGWKRRVMGDLDGVQMSDIGVVDRAVRLARAAAVIPPPKAPSPGKALPSNPAPLPWLPGWLTKFLTRLRG